MTTMTNMPTPEGVCEEIRVFVEPVIRAFSVPTASRAVKDREVRRRTPRQASLAGGWI